jgi:signal transduction histidine kinase/CheY-like chemotaxis protein
MPRNVLAKYSADYLFDLQNVAVAVADKNFKIVWYNQSFKKSIGPGRINGVSVEKLFHISPSTISESFQTLNSFSSRLPDNKNLLTIKPLSTGKKSNQAEYIVELTQIISNEQNNIQDSFLLERNIKFQNELQNILFLLVKESSSQVVIEEILSRCVKLTGSDFGVIILHNENTKFSFQYYDPAELLQNKKDIEKTIHSDFSYIRKWLEHNNQSLVVNKRENNIGANLNRVFASESLIVTPCFFDKALLATIVAGRNSGTYSSFEINQLEQLGILLSFAISNIRTRELNTTLENRLLQAQKLETIGKLSSGMAHDFSNLLSSIFGSINLLRRRVPQAETVDKLIDNIENCSIRARDLTKGLLSFGKPTPKRKELVKPNRLLNEISKVVTQTFPGSITFANKVDENLFDILGNETEIYQVLLNLCVNAKEATDSKGNIILSSSNFTVSKKNLLDFPLLNEGNYVHFSVSDDGVGIKDEDLQKIFDPYFSTKSKDTGSGLGLYVTYGIIKAHNGVIDVSSKISKGTTFNVYIPSYEPTKIKKSSEKYEKIILLADDEPMLNDLLAELLESNGYSVIKVGSGEEALKLLTEEIKVDLAIIDYNMPKLSGLDTIAEIRKLNLDIPIILSSGSMWLDENEELFKHKIESRLQKPYEFETMLSTIQKFI